MYYILYTIVYMHYTPMLSRFYRKTLNRLFASMGATVKNLNYDKNKKIITYLKSVIE